jgi:hypothetical protein
LPEKKRKIWDLSLKNVIVLNILKQGDRLCYKKYNIGCHEIRVVVKEKKNIIFLEQQVTLIVHTETYFLFE